jgi:hypothetical protein
MMTMVRVLLLLVFFNAGAAVAQTQQNRSLAERSDCSNISVDYRNNPNLTQQEKIELMDKALFHSLNKYEGCKSKRASAAASGGGAGGSQSGEGGGSGKGGSGTSTASSEMTGTQTPVAQESASDKLSDKAVTDQGSNKPVQNTHIKGSGKIPDDIPKVDNDSILEAQIRQAAIDETDPAIKAKLWNEYRKYKGLPAQ